jgi:hypothetical protein
MMEFCLGVIVGAVGMVVTLGVLSINDEESDGPM